MEYTSNWVIISRLSDYIVNLLRLDPMGPQHHYSTLMVRSFSHLLGTGSPFEKLVAISSAATTQRALDYKLDFSVLLKGARGAGKFTTACWVAQRLGMHLLEARDACSRCLLRR